MGDGVRILDLDLVSMTTDAGLYLLLGADIFYRLVEREHASGSDQIHGKESTDTFYCFDFHFWFASLQT